MLVHRSERNALQQSDRRQPQPPQTRGVRTQRERRLRDDQRGRHAQNRVGRIGQNCPRRGGGWNRGDSAGRAMARLRRGDELQPSQFRDADLGRGPGRAHRAHRDLRHRAHTDRASSARGQGNSDHRPHLTRPLRAQHRRRMERTGNSDVRCVAARARPALRPRRRIHHPAQAPVDRGQIRFRGKFLYHPWRLLRAQAGAAAMAADHERRQQPRRRDFAARHADLNFALGPDLPTLAATCADVKRMARERYGREISVFTMGYVVWRETEREALRYRDYYVKEKGDFAAAHNLLETLIPNSQSALGDQYKAMIENFIAGYSALPLVGTPEQVVDGIFWKSRAGFDGLTLSCVDYDEGIAQYRDQLRPLLIQAGLRVE